MVWLVSKNKGFDWKTNHCLIWKLLFLIKKLAILKCNAAFQKEVGSWNYTDVLSDDMKENKSHLTLLSKCRGGQASLGSWGIQTASCISGMSSVQSSSKCHGYSSAVLDLRNLGAKTWAERANIWETGVYINLWSLCLRISERVVLKTNGKAPWGPVGTHKISELIKEDI